MRDPRLYQVAVLSTLLGYGAFALRFDLRAEQVVAIAAAALGTQLACARLARLPSANLRSALISTLSLCLLLRADSAAVAIFAAVATIGSKFAIRWRGKHLFNPTTFGIALTLLVSDRAWVSSGQWGSAAYFACLVACAGLLVVRRAERSDVTWSFLGCYAALLFGRALWLGDPLAIPLHQLQSGTLLVFAFFMISDPRTTPNSRAGRVLFAALVATGGFAIQYGFYAQNGLIWSLAACAPLLPAIDRWLPGRRFRWHREEERHATGTLPRGLAGLRAAG